MDHPAPLILTLTLDECTFAFFEEQRQRYFPPERNYIPAHLTLFHQLPGEHLDEIVRDAEALVSHLQAIPLRVTGLRSLGRGVAYTVASPELAKLRKAFAEKWNGWLGPQDRQPHQPHVTVQNKVAPEQARELHSQLNETFEPFTATGTGLDLWWYRGGPWEKARSFCFSG